MLGQRYWVIREISTGKLFPASKSRGNTSYLEFSDELAPRLFTRRQDALFVARWWLQGHVFQTYAQRTDEYDSFQMTVKPVEGRSMDNIELVEVTLVMTT
jgi:hypothetical protein